MRCRIIYFLTLICVILSALTFSGCESGKTDDGLIINVKPYEVKYGIALACVEFINTSGTDYPEIKPQDFTVSQDGKTYTGVRFIIGFSESNGDYSAVDETVTTLKTKTASVFMIDFGLTSSDGMTDLTYKGKKLS